MCGKSYAICQACRPLAGIVHRPPEVHYRHPQTLSDVTAEPPVLLCHGVGALRNSGGGRAVELHLVAEDAGLVDRGRREENDGNGREAGF